MRLLQRADDGQFVLTKKIYGTPPPYAILSHTWSEDEDDEVSLSDLQSDRRLDKPGYKKILFCAREARRFGLKHFWIDTCCFDKSSSAELQETITAMFRYYLNARVCFAYLSDVRKREFFSSAKSFIGSRWFTRGWTLQELLAPEDVRFYDRQEQELGTKKSLAKIIELATGIPHTALSGAPLYQFDLGSRLQWAKGRETKREEDQAYCLLGILGINMYINYGEGEDSLRRLGREVDLSADEVSKRLNGADTESTPLSNSATYLKPADDPGSRPRGESQPGPRKGVLNPISWDENPGAAVRRLYFLEDNALFAQAIEFCQNGNYGASKTATVVLAMRRFSEENSCHHVSTIDQLGSLPIPEKEEITDIYEKLFTIVQKEAAARTRVAERDGSSLSQRQEEERTAPASSVDPRVTRVRLSSATMQDGRKQGAVAQPATTSTLKPRRAEERQFDSNPENSSSSDSNSGDAGPAPYRQSRPLSEVQPSRTSISTRFPTRVNDRQISSGRETLDRAR